MAITRLPKDVIRQHKGVSFPGITTVFLCYDGKGRLLLSKRSPNTRDEQGRWEPGGGSLKLGQSVEESMLRELKEEYNADALEVTFVGYYDAFRSADDGTPTHWLAMCFAVRVDPEHVGIGEPDKIDELGWFTLDDLPQPMHSQFANYFNKYEDRIRELVAKS